MSPASTEVLGARFNILPLSSYASPPVKIANTLIISADMAAWRMMFST